MKPTIPLKITEIINLIQNNNLKDNLNLVSLAAKENLEHLEYIFQIGTACAESGRVEDALIIFNCLKLAKPDDSRVSYNLGYLYAIEGKFQDALECFHKALEYSPNDVEILTNYANTLHELKCYEDAIVYFDKALVLNPDYAEAYANKGNTLNELKRYAEAITHCEKAIFLNPDYAEAYANKGNTLKELKRYGEAITQYDKALRLSPHNASYFYKKALINISLNHYDLAIDNLENSIKYKYNRIGHAEYVLSALKPENGLKPMPKDFVADLFDKYADSFDEHLVQMLQYNSPEILFGILDCGTSSKYDILDMGCGTGLMGKLLKPYASRLVGVDLSKEMLSKAALTEAYDELVEDDVQEFLTRCDAEFDLVVSADVFIYIGKLDDIFMNASRLIKNKGLFCFSLEKLQTGMFSLSPRTLRFSHSKDYIHMLALQHNFVIKNYLEAPIRQENQVDVDGYYFLLQKD